VSCEVIANEEGALVSSSKKVSSNKPAEVWTKELHVDSMIEKSKGQAFEYGKTFEK
jgi:hypothetical protein